MTETFEPFVSFLTPAAAGRRKPDAPAHIMGVLLLLLLLLSALLPGAVTAESEWQSTTDIEAVAEAFVATHGRARDAVTKAAPLDPRLKLRHCDRALEAFLRNGARVSRRTIVGVRCSGSQPWKVYVPVDVVVTDEVVVVRQSLSRGHRLRAGDLRREERDVSRLHGGYIVEVDSLVGQELRQSLAAGSIVTPSVLQARTLIRRGQTVTLQVRTDDITIRMAGKALMDGTLDQRIRVENTMSRRVVEGQVRSAEVVEVLVQ
jgi:flagella basal body P-ring formation protein FlgA